MEHPIIDKVYGAKGDSLAADALIREYMPFIKATASKAAGKAIDESDDEFSIAMLGFHQAVESYARQKGAFLGYADVVIRRKIIDYFRTQNRHSGQISLEAPMGEDGTLGETLASDADPYAEAETLQATKGEIAELAAQLGEFGLSLTDIADNSPKQDRTLAACRQVLAFALENPSVMDELKRTKKLPLAKLTEGAAVERKTLERHRKYLIALLLLFSNGYVMIRGHLRQVLQPRKGGAGK